VGQNAKENWQLIEIAEPFDLWFHLDDKSSGHVIIKEIFNGNKNMCRDSKYFGYPYEIIIKGAEYCKSQSKYKMSKVTIVYTTIENIKKGKDVGSVIIRKYSQFVII
jgi:predicted ribosome quality control (RQC) complex YloA/Tae2 family protein